MTDAAIRADTVVVGSGVGGATVARELARQGEEVVVLEKGSEVGAHILSGAVVDPVGIDRLLPGWRSEETPFKTPVTDDRFLFLGHSGSIRLPGDKSVSHRYAMLGAIAEGVTSIRNYSTGADCGSTLACIRALGVPVVRGLEIGVSPHARPRRQRNGSGRYQRREPRILAWHLAPTSAACASYFSLGRSACANARGSRVFP